MKYFSWITLVVALVLSIGILSVQLYSAKHRADVNELAVDRYNGICRSVGSRLHLAALDAAEGNQKHLEQPVIEHAVHYDYSILQGCALTPINTNAIDECWIMGDMPCLARELDKIAAQLPSWRDP